MLQKPKLLAMYKLKSTFNAFLLLIILSGIIPVYSFGQVQIQLPPGFSSITVVEELGPNRHLAVNANGDIFVKMRELKNGKGIMQLRDINGDGRADSIRGFGHFKGTGIAIQDNYLFASSNADIFRYTLDPNGNVVNPDAPDKIVFGLLNDESHNSKAFTLDDAGNLFVNIGAPSNSCQESDRMKGSMGMDPCPLLSLSAGIWKFSSKNSSKHKDRENDMLWDYATLSRLTGIQGIITCMWFSMDVMSWIDYFPRGSRHNKTRIFLQKRCFSFVKEEIMGGPIAITIPFKERMY